ncbi:amino acid ABC transporter permease [Rhodobacteraceae bacterium D3-12]|nr:amino acid ABC transporter permease [Rhodobacteraceae bacterium D3-12]
MNISTPYVKRDSSVVHRPRNFMSRLGHYANKHPVIFVFSTLLLLVIIGLGAVILDWAVFRGIWSAPDSQACRAEGVGACWAVIGARWRIIFFGLYPFDEQWRSAIACAVMLATAITSCFPRFWTFKRLSILWVAGYVVFYILMGGGVFGLKPVTVQNWGGLALTFFVFGTCTILTMPLAVVLVLLRQSSLYMIWKPTQLIIDFVRSMPLLVVMFVTAVIVPFGLPDALIGEKLYRVILGFAFYNACYQAEILRGGIQSLPQGQDEAAKALGLSYRHRVSRIILPQAFKITLPATINQIVIIFLETPLISIIGFFEVLASGAAAFGTLEWGVAVAEVYLFISIVFFMLSFSLSSYGRFLEKHLSVNER